jgi:antitoxin (DNA-binding transcriptional repressor) of toxin-antitoxin stability system
LKKIQMRALSQRVNAAMREVERSGEPVIVMRHNRPVAFLIAVDSTVGEDLVLAFAPETEEILSAAERERVAGRAQAWERV